MQLGIRYETVYRYDEEVAFSPHEVRLFPRSDRFARVRRLSFSVNGETAVRDARDVFDNTVAVCFFREKMRELRFGMELDLELEEKAPFDFILEAEAVEMPFAYAAPVAAVLAPFRARQSSGGLEIAGWDAPTADARQGTVSTLVGLVKALHETIVYERREEGAARSPEETLRLGRGACRDVTVLLAEVLRANGLAARLVSGYLRELDEESRRAEGSLHAWTEVFLPGAGWVGLDATNGLWATHNFIAAAVGLVPADITPISGSYHKDRQVHSEMSSRLELVAL
ncbi:hypothetical protein BH20VER2_BH20VER2_04580 [soil metagenome]